MLLMVYDEYNASVTMMLQYKCERDATGSQKRIWFLHKDDGG
jgi:hypothetical protein